MKKTILLTGATGFLGCHLAHRFLADGHRVVALVRSKEGEVPQTRLQEAVLQVGDLATESLDNLHAVSGTVQDAPEKLMANVRAVTNQHIDEVWHSAAIFNFRPRDRQKVTAVNIRGTQNVLDLAISVNFGAAPRFFYISTAYCVGRENNAAVPETIPHNVSDFRSMYEWSKHEAERRVEQMQREHGLDAFVLRPSIIIGTPKTRVTCTSGYYQVVTECKRLRDLMAQTMGHRFNGDVQTRLIGDNAAPLNLVPIDFVVDSMSRLAAALPLNTPRLKVFNLVNEAPPPMKTVHAAVTTSLEMTGLRLVSKAAFEKKEMTHIEKLVNRRISFQAPYMQEEIHFLNDCFRKYVPHRVLPTPIVSKAYLMALNALFFEQLVDEALLST